MRLATVRTAAGTAAARVNDLRSATLIEGYADVGELLRNPEWRAIATRPGPDVEFNPLEVAPIVVRPEKIICVGLNYAAHIEEMGHEQPDVPTLFVKFADALIGAFDDAEVPEFNAGALDFEGELAVIIGAHARHVDDAEATACIIGYSVINDYTQRHFQKRTQQWHQENPWKRPRGSARGSTPSGRRARGCAPTSTASSCSPPRPMIWCSRPPAWSPSSRTCTRSRPATSSPPAPRRAYYTRAPRSPT